MGRSSDHGRDDPYALDQYGALIDEALALLGEGVPAARVEEASRALGLREGALAVLDRVSLAAADALVHSDHGHAHVPGHGHGHGHQVAPKHAHGRHEAEPHHDHEHHEHHHHHDDHEHHEHHHHQHDHDHPEFPRTLTKDAVYVVEKMSHGLRRMGRDAGGGFYQYPDDEPPTLWSGLKQFERRGRDVPHADIADRLRYAQLIALERLGGVRSPAPGIEIAATHIARIGHDQFVSRCAELASAYGERFVPPPSLRSAPGGTDK